MLNDHGINKLINAIKSEIAIYSNRTKNLPMKEIAFLTVVISDDVNLRVARLRYLSLECMHHGHRV